MFAKTHENVGSVMARDTRISAKESRISWVKNLVPPFSTRVMLKHDEGIRPGTNAEALGNLMTMRLWCAKGTTEVASCALLGARCGCGMAATRVPPNGGQPSTCDATHACSASVPTTLGVRSSHTMGRQFKLCAGAWGPARRNAAASRWAWAARGHLGNPATQIRVLDVWTTVDGGGAGTAVASRSRNVATKAAMHSSSMHTARAVHIYAAVAAEDMPVRSIHANQRHVLQQRRHTGELDAQKRDKVAAKILGRGHAEWRGHRQTTTGAAVVLRAEQTLGRLFRTQVSLPVTQRGDGFAGLRWNTMHLVDTLNRGK